MTVQEMGALFQRNGVPADYYVLDGSLGAGECYGIEQSEGHWVVYYSERGTKNVLAQAATEDAACRRMIEYISKSMQHRFGRPLDGD